MLVAINCITCRDDYRPRFEELLTSRAGAIDWMPRFIRMHVPRPVTDSSLDLVVSEWESGA